MKKKLVRKILQQILLNHDSRVLEIKLKNENKNFLINGELYFKVKKLLNPILYIGNSNYIEKIPCKQIKNIKSQR